ncbi:lactonase family protein [Anditalea andensis]|nr:lactonase family protein [Anditalea andensis]
MIYLKFCLGLILAFMTNAASSQQTDTKTFLVGTYTEKESQGVNLVSFKPDKEPFEIASVHGNIKNPSYVIANKAGTFAFAVQESEGARGGEVTSFSIDKEANKISKINSVKSEGDGPCYLSLDPNEKFLLVGNYGGGNLSIIPINADGKLISAIQTIAHTGSSVNKDRQEGPHVHSVVFHPAKNQLFVADLGIDQVNIYDFDPKENAPLMPSTIPNLKVKPGSGPRHLIFNENGDHLYLVHEMKGEVGFYKMEDNTYEHVATYPMADNDFKGEHGGAEIRITKDFKYIYASNRGDANEITVFQRDEPTGTLKPLQRISSGGKTPRNFVLTPDEEYLIAANQGSNNLVLFKRDQSSGKLEKTDQEINIHKPVYLHFID